MAKDPAFLFYTSDFLTGTLTMTDEQVGKYIRLLCLQHQKGALSEKDMLFICKSYDEDIFGKFVKSESGYYNQRLKDESEKRSKYSLSRANNRKKKEDVKNICNSYVQHMENENENIDKGVVGEKEESRFTSFRTSIFYDVETLKASNHWKEVGEIVYRKSHRLPSKDGGLIKFCLENYDLWLISKGEWLKGVTPERFAAGLAKWVINDKEFSK